MCTYASVHMDMKVEEAMVANGEQTTYVSVRIGPSPLDKENVVKSPNLQVTHIQTSSSNLVEVFNMHCLLLPLSSKRHKLLWQSGANNKADIVEVSLLVGILLGINITHLLVTNSPHIYEGQMDIYIMEIDSADIPGGDH